MEKEICQDFICFEDVKETQLYKTKFSIIDDFIQSFFSDENENQKIDNFMKFFRENQTLTFFYIKFFNYFENVRINERKLIGKIFKRIFEDFPFLKDQYTEPIVQSYRELAEILVAEGIIDKTYETCPYPNAYDLYPHDSILYMIQYDLIDELQQYLTANPNYDIHHKIRQYYHPSYPQCNLFNEESITLLDLSCFFGAIECFKYLIMNHCNISEYTTKYAAAGGNNEIIHILEQKNASFIGTLYFSIQFHRNDISNWLYFNYDSIVYLKDCIYNYDIQKFIFFVLSKECSSEELQNALIYSCYVGILQLTQFLIDDMHINPNASSTNCTPLIAALSNHHDHIVRYLVIEKNADVNYSLSLGLCPLLVACREGELSNAKLLIEHGAHVNETNAYFTPLSIAANNNHHEIVQYLCENFYNELGSDKCIEAACKIGSLPVFNFCIEKQLFKNIKDSQHIMLMTSACLGGNVQIIKYLIDNHIFNKNDRDKNGRTPLIHAVIGYSFDAIKYLVEELHVNINDTDAHGHSALYYSDLHDDKIYNYLLQHGAVKEL